MRKPRRPSSRRWIKRSQVVRPTCVRSCVCQGCCNIPLVTWRICLAETLLNPGNFSCKVVVVVLVVVVVIVVVVVVCHFSALVCSSEWLNCSIFGCSFSARPMFVVFSVEVRFVRRPFSCVFWLWVFSPWEPSEWVAHSAPRRFFSFPQRASSRDSSWFFSSLSRKTVLACNCSQLPDPVPHLTRSWRQGSLGKPFSPSVNPGFSPCDETVLSFAFGFPDRFEMVAMVPSTIGLSSFWPVSNDMARFAGTSFFGALRWRRTNERRNQTPNAGTECRWCAECHVLLCRFECSYKRKRGVPYFMIFHDP